MKTKNYVFAIAMVLAGFASCQKLKEMKEAAFAKTLKEIIQEAEAATFIIYTYDEFGSPSGSGSGFFIDKTGVGMTNYHVLDGAVKAVIKTSDEKEYEIDKVIFSDKKWDIVQFTTKNDGAIFDYLKFSKSEIEKGDEVYNISSPMGLEKTVSTGIISSLREDKQHGDVVQITAPISPGSSGSPIMDKNGDVIAVATFNRRGGQNLNFGVRIDNAKLRNLTNTDFSKNNPKFNSKANFVILNIPADRGSDIMLNAIEFGESATTLYLSYTNLDLTTGDSYGVYCPVNRKDEGFLIEDLESNKKYYLTSSTISADATHLTEVPLASTIHFKVYFPAIKDNLNNINITEGHSTNSWRFTNIDLDKYRKIVNVNFEDYQKLYALAIMREGELSNAQDILLEVIENNPNDILALHTLGIISYVIDNNQSALYYFSQAIEANPNDELAYVNRYAVHKYQKNYPAALEDLNKAIGINPDLSSSYYYRALIYINTEDWKNAKADLDRIIATDDFKRDAWAYYYRARVNTWLNNWKAACQDIKVAYNLTSDKEFEARLQEMWDKCGCK